MSDARVMIRGNVAKAGALAAGVGFPARVMSPVNKGAKCGRAAAYGAHGSIVSANPPTGYVVRPHTKHTEAGPCTLFPQIDQWPDRKRGVARNKLGSRAAKTRQDERGAGIGRAPERRPDPEAGHPHGDTKVGKTDSGESSSAGLRAPERSVH